MKIGGDWKAGRRKVRGSLLNAIGWKEPEVALADADSWVDGGGWSATKPGWSPAVPGRDAFGSVATRSWPCDFGKRPLANQCGFFGTKEILSETALWFVYEPNSRGQTSRAIWKTH